MSTGLVLSVVIHALLLSLTFGSQGFGLPGLDLPWRERRFEADDMRLALMPVQVTAAAPGLIESRALIESPQNLMPTGLAKAESIAAPSAMTEMVSTPPSMPENVAPPPTPALTLTASDRPDPAPLVVPVTPLVATPVIVAVPSATSPAVAISTPPDPGDASQRKADPEVLVRAFEPVELNRAKQEVQQQVEQLDAARESAARTQATQVEVERQEAARQAAAHQEAERAQAAKQESAKQESAKQESAKQERERQMAARAEQEARREAVLRAIGR